MIHFQLTDQEPLTEWRGLGAALAASTAKPVLPTVGMFQSMSRAQREALNDSRVAFMEQGLTITTPQLMALGQMAEKVMEQNRWARNGRRGVLLTGPSSVGKTTACISLMRYVHMSFISQHPDIFAGGAVPVAYVEVPPSSTPKGVMQRFADFYAIPYAERTSLNILKKAVVAAMRATRTSLVVVDEVHNLSMGNGINGPSVDTLKDLSNGSPATFVYAGISLESSGLLAGARGDQVARRFIALRMTLFGYETVRERSVWQGIVGAFSKELPLFSHDPLSLLAHGEWLHKQSGGNIGTLQSILIQSSLALIEAEEPESEQITRELISRSYRDIRAVLGQERLDRAELTARSGRRA